MDWSSWPETQKLVLSTENPKARNSWQLNGIRIAVIFHQCLSALCHITDNKASLSLKPSLHPLCSLLNDTNKISFHQCILLSALSVPWPWSLQITSALSELAHVHKLSHKLDTDLQMVRDKVNTSKQLKWCLKKLCLTRISPVLNTGDPDHRGFGGLMRL